MKILILLSVFSFSAFATGTDGTYICPYKAAAEAQMKAQQEQQQRMPASTHTNDSQRLLQLDMEKGCCNNHGGFSECKDGVLQCRDGSVSSCNC